MKDYVLTLLVTVAVTYLLTPLVRKVAIRAHAMKAPRERDVHEAPVPLWGGVAMYLGMAAGFLVADQIQLRNAAFDGTGMVGLLAAGALIVIIGLIDDRWGMNALTKLAGQIAAGAILVATGTQLSSVPYPGGSTFSFTTNQGTLVTILVVVVTINAVNFIDGLDGLAAGIVGIASVSFFLYYYSMSKIVSIGPLAAPALASALVVGMCLGFLPHNFHPARIFMGDTGSMLLGLLLAYAPIEGISSLEPGVQASSQVNRFPEIMPLLLPAVLLVIPYADLLLAVVRRTRAGTSPFVADRKHLHHRLMEIGHSQRTSVLIMYLWAALFSGSVVWLSTEKTQQKGVANHHGNPLLVFVAITIGAMIVLLLLSMPQLRFWNRGKLAGAAGPAGELADQARSVVGQVPPAVAAASRPEALPRLLGSAAVINHVRPAGLHSEPSALGGTDTATRPVPDGVNGHAHESYRPSASRHSST